MTDQPPDEPSDGGFEPAYDGVQQWVEEVYSTTFVRRVRARWCARWWTHPEAVVRLTALWQSWELYRLEPGTGIADWLTRYLDPIQRELCSEEGPFSACTPDRHTEPTAWPVDPVPPGALPDAAPRS